VRLTTIGLKLVMAVSGAGLVGFVLFHMLGNLQVFAGQEAFNDYAMFIKGTGGLLWVARAGLFVFVVAHVLSAIRLANLNRAARPQRYEVSVTQRTSAHARIMLHTGVVVLAFVAYHLAHLTFGAVHPQYAGLIDEWGRPDVYNMFVLSFRDPVIASTYVVANLAVASHLAHAATSMLHTLGVAVGPLRRPLGLVGPAIGLVVAVGNVSLPLACLLGIVRPEGLPP
jgi:succinate dehydrogenase / fumarate reductase cytochrome b subunit